MKKLAISGGPAVVSEHMIQKWPIISDEDINGVVTALKSGKLWGIKTPNVQQLEADLCQYFDTRYCILTQSGTSALHMAIAALGIGPGDEVITTSYSFVSTALAVLHANAIPIFTDIDPQSCNINVQDIEDKINPSTKAILPVHMHGLPANMDEINALAKKYGLAVIEDACQAHGAVYKGQKVGNLSDVACFSLNGSKNLNAGGDGGFLLTNSKTIYQKALSVAMYGKSVSTDKSQGNNINSLGWMYRIQEIPATIARSQLQRLDEYNAIRTQNAEYLTKGLSEFKGLISPKVPDDRTHVYFTYRLRFDPDVLGIQLSRQKFREAIEKALFAEGVPMGQSDKLPLYKYPLFRDKTGYGKQCPWSCNFNTNKPQALDDNLFPHVNQLFEDYTVIRGIHAPNNTDLMDLYLEAMGKVYHHLEEVIGKAETLELPSNNCELFGGYY